MMHFVIDVSRNEPLGVIGWIDGRIDHHFKTRRGGFFMPYLRRLPPVSGASVEEGDCLPMILAFDWAENARDLTCTDETTQVLSGDDPPASLFGAPFIPRGMDDVPGRHAQVEIRRDAHGACFLCPVGRPDIASPPLPPGLGERLTDIIRQLEAGAL